MKNGCICLGCTDLTKGNVYLKERIVTLFRDEHLLKEKLLISMREGEYINFSNHQFSEERPSIFFNNAEIVNYSQ